MKRKYMIFLMLVVSLTSCKERYQRKNSLNTSFIENKSILKDNFALELERWAEDVENNILHKRIDGFDGCRILLTKEMRDENPKALLKKIK